MIIENLINAPWLMMVALLENLGYDAANTKLDTKKYYIPHTRNRGYEKDYPLFIPNIIQRYLMATLQKGGDATGSSNG